MNEHTPVPWRTAGSGPSTQNFALSVRTEKGGIAEGTICRIWQRPEAQSNAAFIVRACNSHEDLMNAAKAIVEAQINGTEADYIVAFEATKAAIAKAQGEEITEPKHPPISDEEVAAQLERDKEIYGNAFAHFSNGRWRRLDPTKMFENVGEEPAPVPHHQFTQGEDDAESCEECGLPKTHDVHNND